MMSIGDTIELLEGVAVVDDLGMDFLPKGTRGRLVAVNGSLLTIRRKETDYQGIPLASAKRVEGEEAKAA